MAASWVSICNIGLIALGEQPIVSLTESSNNAKILAACWRALIDEVTTEHWWACATVRQAINPLTAAPDSVVWSYQYQLPVSPLCLAVRGVDPDSAYVVEGNTLLSNENELNLLYTGQITDPALIPPMLAKAMGMKIAEYLAVKFPQKEGATKFINKYEAALLKAKWADNRGKMKREADVEGSDDRQRLDEVT